MSTPGNTAKLGTAQSNIQTAQSRSSLVVIEPTILLTTRVSMLQSQRTGPPWQPQILSGIQSPTNWSSFKIAANVCFVSHLVVQCRKLITVIFAPSATPVRYLFWLPFTSKFAASCQFYFKSICMTSAL